MTLLHTTWALFLGKMSTSSLHYSNFIHGIGGKLDRPGCELGLYEVKWSYSLSLSSQKFDIYVVVRCNSEWLSD